MHLVSDEMGSFLPCKFDEMADENHNVGELMIPLVCLVSTHWKILLFQLFLDQIVLVCQSQTVKELKHELGGEHNTSLQGVDGTK